MLVPEEQSILSASAVYLWQRIKARKIKHFLISPENLPFSNLETPILENPFFFFPLQNEYLTPHHYPGAQTQASRLKDLTKELMWTLKFSSFNYEIAWFTELIRCCSFGGGVGGMFWNTESSTQIIMVFTTGDGSKVHQLWVPTDTGPFLTFKWALE